VTRTLSVIVLALLALLALTTHASAAPAPPPRVVVLGTAQDGGLPQAGCRRACCSAGRHAAVASLALVDEASRRWWLFDATPDLREQLAAMQREAPDCRLAGVFLTHAHIGHYAGLMHFGREVMGTRELPVWAMPRMRAFLATNGPWSQLVTLRQVELRALAADSSVELGAGLRVTPFVVPHRDEFSETVGYRIAGPGGAVVFLPDIDKWERWDRRIEDVVAGVSAAYLDGTFFDGAELPGRDMREIPHPFLVESLERFAAWPAAERARVRFLHLNHTNRAAVPGSAERRRIERAGMRLAVTGERVAL
jgi:pyrroloquinoline quinone biosynthesis protein B